MDGQTDCSMNGSMDGSICLSADLFICKICGNMTLVFDLDLVRRPSPL